MAHRPRFLLNAVSGALSCVLTMTACAPNEQQATEQQIERIAPGAPGVDPIWAFSGKTGIGTSYTPYQTDAAQQSSKVWFSLAQGIVTETMFGLIHNAQLKEMQFIIAGEDFTDTEQTDTHSTIDYLHKDSQGRPLSLAYKVVNTDKQGKYQIEKHIFTDPDSQSLVMKVFFTAFEPSITPYLYVNPHIDNSGANDIAYTTNDGQALIARTNEQTSSVLSVISDKPFVETSVGFVGKSDGLTDLNDNGQLDWRYDRTADATNSSIGNVAMTAKLPTLEVKNNNSPDNSISYSTTFVVGFGDNEQQSLAHANKTLALGYDKVLANYNGIDEAVGWQDYLNSLSALPAMVNSSADNGELLYASALVLKAQEDKTHPGALIASLSNPWGDTVSAKVGSTGYKAVWPRDFYQCAMAFLAMGDTQTPKVAFEYLQKVQVTESTPGYQGTPGWFLQKTHVDGQIEWVGVQLDQTAMPLMLAWQLWQADVLSDAEIQHWYQVMLKSAADFLVTGGKVKLDWNYTEISPLNTQQERWEEQAGYSPSTAAAVIAGLISASEMAALSGDTDNAKRYLDTAIAMESKLTPLMVTDTGLIADSQGDNTPYYVRISPNGKPNTNAKLVDNNGRPGLDQRLVLDGGFLELVRYGVKPANDTVITNSLSRIDNTELEDNLRVKYLFKGKDGQTTPGYRRYGNDGYGEDELTGSSYAENGSNTPGQRGRVWPFFTGERGHYELAKLTQANQLTAQAKQQLIATYVKGMENFANEGLMLPEQVWDGVGNPTRYEYQKGQGTNSATPLAWTHAEYVKLLRSMTDEQVWDYYPNVSDKLNP
ncbi:glycoside hydrolase family 15 protein [Shewanella waksmanii]|uniref:glycoside hydrolase family 15 protein n=1 Tax=Shewanella waksmanii TaxID=213783 RepID=UPI0037368593